MQNPGFLFFLISLPSTSISISKKHKNILKGFSEVFRSKWWQYCSSLSSVMILKKKKKSKPSYNRGDIRMVDYGCSCSINECDAYKHLFQTEILGITAKVIGPLSLAAFQRIMTGFDLKMEHRGRNWDTPKKPELVFLYQLRLLPLWMDHLLCLVISL